MLGVLDIQRVTIKHKILLAALLLAGVFLFGSGRAQAATLNVTGGCTLPIAINAVNAGADQSGCTAVVSPDGYGTNDTITIPAGTQTLTSDSPNITVSVKIQGAGMSQTTIDGNAGQYRTIRINNSTASVTVQDLKIVSYLGQGIISNNGSVTLSNIEIDGSDALPTGNQLKGVELGNQAAANVTTTVNNLYVHDLDASATQGVYAFSFSTPTANIQNTTVANIHNSAGDAGAFFVIIAGTGTVNANVYNTTINNISASAAALGFGSIGAALSGNTTIHVIVKNVTVVGLDGSSGAIGQNSVAFFTGGAAATPHTASVTMNVENSLLANNTSDNVSSNCAAINGNAAFGGLTGTVITEINSDGHNLSDDNTCTSFTEDGDQQNLANLFATLGPLQDNGGPVPTMALLAGSPAINAGSQVLGISTDARGVARNSCPSVGAFQFEGAVCAASTTNGGDGNSNGGSLAETGQNTKTSILVGILLISAVLATATSRQRIVYKRRQGLL